MTDNLIEVYRNQDLQGVDVQEVVELKPESKYILVVSDDAPIEIIHNLHDGLIEFLNSKDQVFLIIGDVKFVKVTGPKQGESLD